MVRIGVVEAVGGDGQGVLRRLDDLDLPVIRTGGAARGLDGHALHHGSEAGIAA